MGDAFVDRICSGKVIDAGVALFTAGESAEVKSTFCDAVDVSGETSELVPAGREILLASSWRIDGPGRVLLDVDSAVTFLSLAGEVVLPSCSCCTSCWLVGPVNHRFRKPPALVFVLGCRLWPHSNDV